MSESDLEKLADLIVDKLVEKQQQIDEEYIAKMLAQQEDMQNESFTELNAEFLKFIPSNGERTKEAKLNDLKEGLKDAISKEDYNRAADIQKNITKLEDEESSDT